MLKKCHLSLLFLTLQIIISLQFPTLPKFPPKPQLPPLFPSIFTLFIPSSIYNSLLLLHNPSTQKTPLILLTVQHSKVGMFAQFQYFVNCVDIVFVIYMLAYNVMIYVRLLPMSSSSSRTKWNGPIYMMKVCGCGTRADIRVTMNKITGFKGRLYYTCRHGTCNFWEWCDPVVRCDLYRMDPIDDGADQEGEVNQIIREPEAGMLPLVHTFIILACLAIIVAVTVGLSK